MSEKAFISLGSNIDPERNLPLAMRNLEAIGEIRAVSAVYQNPSVGPTPQPDFLNAAVLIATDLEPLEIRAILREIEAAMGRVRSEDKYAPREIDLDLCLLGAWVFESPGLTLPDPDLLLRPHLIVPMAELAPDFRHPLTGERLFAIAERLKTNADLTPRPDVSRKMKSHL
jgi:2-amino-4-hydroxy-6-hydroxymethyldihydropteridine diphosphokinase